MEEKKEIPYYIIWQAIIWERFARISPVILVLSAMIFYVIGFRNWQLLIDVVLTMGLSIFIVWWFWIMYTVATIAYVIEKSSGRLKDIITDIRSVKQDIKEFGKSFEK